MKSCLRTSRTIKSLSSKVSARLLCDNLRFKVYGDYSAQLQRISEDLTDLRMGRLFWIGESTGIF